MRGAGERRGLVEHAAAEGDDLGAARRVVALGELGAVLLRDGVGAVERVVERAPARVRGVERVARVHHRHHQLRTGLHGELVIHVGGGGLGAGRSRQQVADRGQEGLVGGHVGNRAGMGAMPGVDLGLDAVALGEQRGVLRREIVYQHIEPGPEGGGVDTAARQGLFFNETLQVRCDLQTLATHSFGHLSHSLARGCRGTRPYSRAHNLQRMLSIAASVKGVAQKSSIRLAL